MEPSPCDVMYGDIDGGMAGLKLGAGKLEKGLSLSRSMAPIPPLPFFLDLVDILRFRVWMPSFFIVSGRFTCKHGHNDVNA